MKYVFLVTLFIQTYNGQVSIQKDLDEKTCKHILNSMSCQSNCMCTGLDENNDMKFMDGHSCNRYVDGSGFKTGECIK